MVDELSGRLESRSALRSATFLYFQSFARSTCLAKVLPIRGMSLEVTKGGTMKLKRVVTILFGMMLLFAGKSSAQQVKTDYDRSANFAQYKTYTWQNVKTKDPLDVDRIKSAVNVALAAKGWTQ